MGILCSPALHAPDRFHYENGLMFPVLFHIGSFAVTTFGLMMFLAFISGAWIGGKQLERYGLPSEYMWDLLAWCAVSGIIGAKLYYLALHWPQVQADPWGMIKSRGGLVWYGGLIGGVIAFGIQVRKKKLPIATMYDGAAPAIALAYAVGRIGCFLVGDDYGRYTTSWVGVIFPEGAAPPSRASELRAAGDIIPAGIPDSTLVPVHPTQLYEVALALGILAILWHIGKRRHKTGQLFAAFLFLYSIERFFIEFVRAKLDRYLFGLSTSQIISIFLFFGAAALWTWRSRVAPDSPIPNGSSAGTRTNRDLPAGRASATGSVSDPRKKAGARRAT
jgi:phosphatidylglycerol:prolipoprotein diacylglycerol transferase